MVQACCVATSVWEVEHRGELGINEISARRICCSYSIVGPIISSLGLGKSMKAFKVSKGGF